jgi:hypothetical protein
MVTELMEFTGHTTLLLTAFRQVATVATRKIEVTGLTGLVY